MIVGSNPTQTDALREVNRGTALGRVHGADLLWRIDGWCNYLLRRFGCQVVKAVAFLYWGVVKR